MTSYPTSGVTSLIPQGFIAAILISVIIYFTYKCVSGVYIYIWKLSCLTKLPGIRGHWLLGGLAEFPGPNEAGLKLLQEAMSYYPRINYGFLGPINIIVQINHPEPVKAILKTSEPKPLQFGGYRDAIPWLGEGLVIAGGKKWARNRRLLTPAFHFDILKPYIAVNNASADTLIENLSAYKGEYIEVFSHISLCTLEIILKCAFSYDEDLQTSGTSHPYVKAVQQLGHTLVYRFLRPWLYPKVLFNLSSIGRQFNKNCDYVHSVSNDVIQRRKKALRDAGSKKEGSRYLDFLDILLTAKDETGQGLSDKEIRAEVDTFLFEGHDTTASGISWILYSLASNPEWQRRCQEEVDGILDGRTSDDILWDDLSSFKTTSACIKEALRLHVPVPLIQRETTKEMYIDGYFIPTGTNVNINIYNILHNPLVWDTPTVYDPNRFLTDSGDKMDSFAFVPFSAGPRNCIGQNFAMHEMKIVVSRVLRRFDLCVDPARPATHEVMVVMKTENGMYLKASPRAVPHK